MMNNAPTLNANTQVQIALSGNRNDIVSQSSNNVAARWMPRNDAPNAELDRR